MAGGDSVYALVTDMGLSKPVGRCEERAKNRRNLFDHRPQTHTLGLERGVQRVVVIRLGSEHMIHQRQPALAKPVGIRMSLVEPVAKKSLTLGRIAPEASSILQS
jgi:hypothetical protein